MYDGMMAETITIAGPRRRRDPRVPRAATRAGPVPGRRRDPPHARVRPADEGDRAHVRDAGLRGDLPEPAPPLRARRAIPARRPARPARPVASPTRSASATSPARCKYLRSLPYANGKVGVIGYCSGGRQSYIVACNLAVRRGRRLLRRTRRRGARGAHARVSRSSPIDMTPNLACPLLGLFGAEDRNPSPEKMPQIEEALQANGKEYEFHTYEDAGHAFFTVDRPNYNVAAANDGWQKIWDFFGRHLAT